jgi:hypothetical protein
MSQNVSTMTATLFALPIERLLLQSWPLKFFEEIFVI